jgi:N-acetyl-anhydromuramyl-L-alanine amidase AmpD
LGFKVCVVNPRDRSSDAGEIFDWKIRVREVTIRSLYPMKPVNGILNGATDYGFEGYFFFYWRFN